MDKVAEITAKYPSSAFPTSCHNKIVRGTDEIEENLLPMANVCLNSQEDEPLKENMNFVIRWGIFGLMP